ncbi:chemotaxis protein CheW [Halorarum salinum]|uniref:Chemotaxis protein CheW n=1 Tax=Halorarum salinum TaxID=2743089 RepID=A0A7D5QHI4_9EURY|nr:chemotaxis protein CheW [Halobaculum salinum]QLG62782.1 chemotaxis protein CheW [Halobaculum salinum]
MTANSTETELEVLEFQVGGEEYCVSLESVEEVVTMDGSLTPLPNADRSVLGVMDLRGRTTSVLDPRAIFDAGGANDEGSVGEYVVVLSEEGSGTRGWLVDAVNRVVSVGEDAIDNSVADGPVQGVLKADEGFTVLVDPQNVS